MDARQFASRWLSGDDLQGKTFTLPIERVTVERVRGESGADEEKLALRLAGAKKALLLSRTNVRAMIDAAGANTDAWPGHVVQLAAERVQAFGKPFNVVRIQTVTKPSAPPTAASTNGARRVVAPALD